MIIMEARIGGANVQAYCPYKFLLTKPEIVICLVSRNPHLILITFFRNECCTV